MKKILFLSIFVFSAAFLFANNPAELVHGVNPEKSSIDWVGKKVTGKHTGTINIKSGELKHEDGRLSGGNFVIDMPSITVTDLEGGMKGKLEGHLKSPDFFDVANFTTAEFVITEVKGGGEAGKYNVTGDLTIKGKTHPVSFTASTNEDGSFGADITVDRTLYDVRYGSGKFFDGLGDKMIYDDFELSVNLVVE
ncbi:MAG: YceI family protein [Bacteroidia bacterium]|nr:YceI family protein [Bacteroidia bacterium]